MYLLSAPAAPLFPPAPSWGPKKGGPLFPSLKLKSVHNSVIISTLRYVNDVLHLKPSLFGLGVNLNAMIEKALGEARRA
jgi:hypothetical protein